MSKHGHWDAFAAAIKDLRATRADACLAAADVIANGSRFYLPHGTAWVFDGKAIDEPIRPLIRLPDDRVAILWFDDCTDGDVDHVITTAVPNPDIAGDMIFNTVVKLRSGWGLIATAIHFHLNDAGGFVLQSGLLQDGAVRLDQDADIRQHATNAASTVINLCALLGTKVGKAVSVAPSQLARLRSKLSLQSYHVLEVSGDLWDRSDNTTGGTGAGSRSHFRRGHIRVLGEGRFTWVRHTIVHGSRPGFVDKEYHV